MKKSLLAFSSLVLSLSMHSAAHAQTPTPEQAYQDAIRTCAQMTDASAQANCRRDAGAALQQAKRTPPAAISESTLRQNRIARCQSLPNPTAQQNCIAHMTGQHTEGQIQTETFGSVEGGGVLRRSTITIQGEPVTVPKSATHPSKVHSAPVH